MARTSRQIAVLATDWTDTLAIQLANLLHRQRKNDLFELCRGKIPGRVAVDEITLFKSCGTAIEDLATAVMVYQKAQ